MADLDYCRTLLFSPDAIPNVLGGSWMHVLFLGLLASAFLMVVAYMISRALRIPRLEGWTRHEFFQILATAGLALFAVILIGGMCTWDVSFLYGGLGQSPPACTQVTPQGKTVATPYCAAQSYLSKLKARGEVLFTALIGINGAMSYLFRIAWESRPLGIGYTVEPLAGLQQIHNVFLVGVSGFLIAYLTILIQMRILDYLMAAVPFYFIPLGFLLRCFAPSREFGGALIGFSIASLLFFPIILVMNDLIVYTSLDAITNSAPDVNAQLYGSDALLGTLPSGLGLDSIAPGAALNGAGGGVSVSQVVGRQGDQVLFVGSDGARYSAQRQGGTVSIYRLRGTIDPAGGGAALNMYWGMYDSQPQADGTWTPRTASTGTPIRYFTDPDPSAANQMVSLRSDKMASAMIWPTQVIMVFSIAAVLLPIINFMIYIEIARELSRLMGTEMDLSNLTRMI